MKNKRDNSGRFIYDEDSIKGLSVVNKKEGDSKENEKSKDNK